MIPFWVTFETGVPGCVEAKSEQEAREIATGIQGKVVSVACLPYPARPRLNAREQGACPSFCFTPSECVGRSSCPRRMSCCD